MNLQVTSPIRKKGHILDAFDSFVDCDHLVSFSNYRLNKSLFMDENDGYLIPSRRGGDYRRQDEPINIYPNGSIWLSTKDNYLRDKTFYSKKNKNL